MFSIHYLSIKSWDLNILRTQMFFFSNVTKQIIPLPWLVWKVLLVPVCSSLGRSCSLAFVFSDFSLRNHWGGHVSHWSSRLASTRHCGCVGYTSWRATSPLIVVWGLLTLSKWTLAPPQTRWALLLYSSFCALMSYSLSWLLMSKLWNQICLLAVSDLVVLNSGEFNSDPWTPTSPIPRACVFQRFLSHKEIILFLSFLSWFRKTGLFECFIMTLGTYRLLFRRVLFSKEC